MEFFTKPFVLNAESLEGQKPKALLSALWPMAIAENAMPITENPMFLKMNKVYGSHIAPHVGKNKLTLGRIMRSLAIGKGGIAIVVDPPKEQKTLRLAMKKDCTTNLEKAPTTEGLNGKLIFCSLLKRTMGSAH
jgi:hypothetical protein